MWLWILMLVLRLASAIWILRLHYWEHVRIASQHANQNAFYRCDSEVDILVAYRMQIRTDVTSKWEFHPERILSRKILWNDWSTESTVSVDDSMRGTTDQVQCSRCHEQLLATGIYRDSYGDCVTGPSCFLWLGLWCLYLIGDVDNN